MKYYKKRKNIDHIRMFGDIMYTDLDLVGRPPGHKPLFIRVKRNLSSTREDQIASLGGIACDL